MFQTKTFVSIVASMINRMRRTTTLFTDYNVGSVVRTIVEAPAQEIDELYQQMLQGLLDAIATSVYTSFNFSLLAPNAASGLVRVTITPAATDTLISANTSATPTGVSAIFASTADATIPAGSSFVDVPVAATVAGSAGNIPVDMVFTLSPSPANFISATNLTAFSNGTDTETEDQRKVRFNQFISTLPRGTNAAVLYGLLTTTISDSVGNTIEAVKTAVVVEPYKLDPTQPTGLILAYVHNGIGGTSAALVAQAQAVTDGYIDVNGNPVPGWKAAGVKAIVTAAADVPVNVTGILTLNPGFTLSTVQQLAQVATNAYLSGLAAGASYQAATLAALLIGISGVSNWTPIAPTVDIAVSSSSKIIPGVVTIIMTPLAAPLAAQAVMFGTLD